MSDIDISQIQIMSCIETSVRVLLVMGMLFFFQAEDGIRDLVRSRGLGDVYKRQQQYSSFPWMSVLDNVALGLRYQGVQKKERNALALSLIHI